MSSQSWLETWPSGEKRIDVPVFPLPKLVLFPGTLLPLHVFEPRYRELMADCLRNKPPLIAVAQLKPGWEPKYEGRPAIYEIAGVGQIKEHVQNRDGTYDILIDALARAHLHELPVDDKRYRRATATLLSERIAKEAAVPSDQLTLYQLATQITSLVKRALPDFTLQATATDAPGVFSDRLADQLILDPSVRQDLLETLDVNARMRTLTLHLTELHASLSSTAQPSGPRTLH